MTNKGSKDPIPVQLVTKLAVKQGPMKESNYSCTPLGKADINVVFD